MPIKQLSTMTEEIENNCARSLASSWTAAEYASLPAYRYRLSSLHTHVPTSLTPTLHMHNGYVLWKKYYLLLTYGNGKEVTSLKTHEMI